MFKNYLKIGLRYLFRKKGYALTNSMSLAVGIASCMLIALYIHNEFSYDKFFEDSDRIYRMLEERKINGDTDINNRIPYSFVGIVPNNYPEVESATAIAGPFGGQQVSIFDNHGEKTSFLEENVLLADSNFFLVFSFKMLSGDRKNALKRPNSVVLSQSLAKKYFKNEEALGKSLLISGRNSVVTGVCQDPPPNSHFKFSYIVSSTTVRWFSQDKFNLRGALCYFKLKPNSDPQLLEKKLPSIVDTYIGGEIERINKTTWEKYQSEGNGFRYYLRPIAAIHLDPDIYGGMKPGGNIVTLRILIAVAALVFAIACINFMNLATARSMERAKEVGLRKVMGSYRTHLISQFLIESLIISFISLIFAVFLTWLTLPFFNRLSDSVLQLDLNWVTILCFLFTTVLVAVLSGLYPAFFLSSFKPIGILKGNFARSTKGEWLKNSLVVFQFWIAIILISSTWVIYQQIQFLSDKDLGYNPEELVVIEGTFHMDANFNQPFLNALQNIPGVQSVAGTLWVPGYGGVWRDEYRTQESTEVHTLSRGAVGDELLNTLDLEIKQGKFFEANTNDSLSVILNETAIKILALKNPIGKKLIMLEHDEGQLTEVPYVIKGVVKDFNFQSLRSDIEPLVLLSNEKFYGRMSRILVKLREENIRETLPQIQEKWEELIPERPFIFHFSDERLEDHYKKEDKLATIFTLFSGLSILLSIVGLLAISIYTGELRKKELGIRKVLGASKKSLLILLSKDNAKVVALSILLATPVAWILMDKWLTDFAYHVNLHWWIFPISSVATLLFTLMAISLQTIKNTSVNPVDSLKDE